MKELDEAIKRSQEKEDDSGLSDDSEDSENNLQIQMPHNLLEPLQVPQVLVDHGVVKPMENE